MTPCLGRKPGDLLLQVLFHSVCRRGAKRFRLRDVAAGFIAKMKTRHPHLYEGGERPNWEEMKAKKRDSIADGLPADLPSLHRAFRLQGIAPPALASIGPMLRAPAGEGRGGAGQVRAEVGRVQGTRQHSA